MSIKQGEFLKELRVKNNLSQEKLGEILGVSRQSVSKWEQGYALPDTENLINISKLYNISVDSILNCGNEEENRDEEEIKVKKSIDAEKLHNGFSKHGWFFWAYPFMTVIAYIALGLFAGPLGWSAGWIVLLTVPVYYSIVFAVKRKNPMFFAYPLVVTIIFLVFGFILQMWHPMWIIFLTIPVYYIIAFSRIKSK